MPGTRSVRKGSFGDDFDGLVTLFAAIPGQRAQALKTTPKEPKPLRQKAVARSAQLQDKIDVHTVLFEMVWPINRPH